MVPETRETLIADETSRFKRNIVLTDVGGGEKTDPMMGPEVGSKEFKEALHLALDAHGYLSLDASHAQYQLKAFIIEVGHPRGGFSAKIDTFVRFTLIRTTDSEVLFDDVLSGAYTATVDDALIGLERWRLAQEGAMRGCISSLLERLHSL